MTTEPHLLTVEELIRNHAYSDDPLVAHLIHMIEEYQQNEYDHAEELRDLQGEYMQQVSDLEYEVSELERQVWELQGELEAATENCKDLQADLNHYEERYAEA